MYEYLLVLLGFLLVAFVLEHTHHVHLYHNRKERLEMVGFFFVLGVAWDSFAIWRGHWAFPEGNNLGLTIGFMPLEEYLFMLIIPYFILTIYKVFDAKFRK